MEALWSVVEAERPDGVMTLTHDLLEDNEDDEDDPTWHWAVVRLLYRCLPSLLTSHTMLLLVTPR